MKKEKFSGWLVAVGVFILCFTIIGVLNTMQVFLPEYLKDGYELAPMMLIVTSTTFFAFLGGLFVGPLTKKTSPRFLFLLGVFLTAGDFFILSVADPLWMFLVGAALGGIGATFATVAPTSMLLTRWFIKKRTTVISVVLAGILFGGVLFVPLSSYLISLFGWRTAYVWLASIILIICLPVVLFMIKNAPETVGQKPYGWNEEPVESIENPVPVALTGIDPVGVLKKPYFWVMAVGFMFAALATSGSYNFMVYFWQSLGMDPLVSGQLSGVFLLISGICTILAGLVAEKWGGKTYILLIGICSLTGNIFIVMAGVAMIPVIMAGLVRQTASNYATSAPSIIVMEAFGKKSYEKVLPLQQAFLGLGAAISPPIFGAMVESSGDIGQVFYYGAAGGLLAMLCHLAAMKMSPYNLTKENRLSK